MILQKKTLKNNECDYDIDVVLRYA